MNDPTNIVPNGFSDQAYPNMPLLSGSLNCHRAGLGKLSSRSYAQFRPAAEVDPEGAISCSA